MKLLNTLTLMVALLTAFPPETAEAVESAKAGYEWKVTVEYPKFGRDDIDGQIKQWLADTILPTAKYTETIADLELEEDGWSMDIEHELHHPSPDVVSVEFKIFMYARGAAHPLTEVQILNFSTATGKKLELADIFKDPQKALEIFAANAKRLIEADLAAAHPEQFSDGFEDMPWFDDGFDTDAENYAELILEPEGVRVCFQQYQILPYVFGISTPLFTLDLLEPAGPSGAIWPKK